MDLETENRIAAMLMKDAAKLRRQAEKEGVLAYFRRPNVRNRPNSRFLTATVLGVQQANRAVEINEMWRLRQKEQELDKGLKRRSGEGSSGNHSPGFSHPSGNRVKHTIYDSSASSSCLSKTLHDNFSEGIKDEELKELLHTRAKRGRGGVGARMDETGPYLPPCFEGEPSSSPDVRERRVVYGPERPPLMKSYNSPDEDNIHEERREKPKKVYSGSGRSEKGKHRSKDKSKNKKGKRKEGKSRD